MSLNCCWMRPNNTSKPIAASQTCSLILVLIRRLHHHCSSWFLTNQASLASPISLPAMRCWPAPENAAWDLCRNCILIWHSCASSSRHRSCARWNFLSCISRSPMRSEPSIAYFRSSWSISRSHQDRSRRVAGAVQPGIVRCHHPVLRIFQGVRFSEAGFLQGQQADAATDRHWPHHHSFGFSGHA